VLLTSLIVAGIGVLGALAVADALRSGRSPSTSATPTSTTPSISTEEDEQQIELIGNQWAPLFAAGRTPGCSSDEGLIILPQGLCEEIACERAGGIKIRNCTPPTSAFRNSFFGATVQDIEIKGNPPRAAARFSNGEVIELIEWGSSWAIAEIGGNAGRTFDVRAEQEIERDGNAWAVRFAAGPLSAACEYETQPLCERIACQRVRGIKIRNCTRPTSAFRNSFFGATVQDIEIKGNPPRAAARFSNGEVVELYGDGGSWAIAELGGKAGSTFFEEP
jgi:hypothetical protein